MQQPGTLVRLPAFAGIGASIWNELLLWQAWYAAGRPESEFQAWLDEHDASFGDFTRRAMIENGMTEQVRIRFDDVLARR